MSEVVVRLQALELLHKPGLGDPADTIAVTVGSEDDGSPIVEQVNVRDPWRTGTRCWRSAS